MNGCQLIKRLEIRQDYGKNISSINFQLTVSVYGSVELVKLYENKFQSVRQKRTHISK